MKKAIAAAALITLIALAGCSTESITGPENEKASGEEILNKELIHPIPDYRDHISLDEAPYPKKYQVIIPVKRN